MTIPALRLDTAVLAEVLEDCGVVEAILLEDPELSKTLFAQKGTLNFLTGLILDQYVARCQDQDLPIPAVPRERIVSRQAIRERKRRKAELLRRRQRADTELEHGESSVDLKEFKTYQITIQGLQDQIRKLESWVKTLRAVNRGRGLAPPFPKLQRDRISLSTPKLILPCPKQYSSLTSRTPPSLFSNMAIPCS